MPLPRFFSAAVLLIRLLGHSALVLGAPAAAFAQIPLNLQFRDEVGQPLPVRVGVFAGTQPRPPQDLPGHLYQFLGPWSHFTCDGFVQVSVPSGPVTVRAGRGFEYQAIDTTVTITSATTLTLTLKRFVQMSAAGWYSGDTHVHITHQPQIYTLTAQHLLLAMKAEDLNYANSMEEPANFTGTIDPLSLPDRIIHFSMEQKNAHLSHLAILGLKQWISDEGCGQQDVACGLTLDAAIYSLVHAQPGEAAVIATHPFVTYDLSDLSPWPGGGMWRGMAIDLPAGAVDAMDLLTYTNSPPPACVGPYFQALNAGFRLPPSAGTDCTLCTAVSKPLAGFRTYVQTSGPFTMDTWIAGFKAGRSFVSNYPLFTDFKIEGAGMGDVLNTSDPTLHGTVSVKCAAPVAKIEIIGDSGTLKVIQPGSPAKSITGSFDIPRDGLSWVVARATGPASSWHLQDAAGLFAQTAPVYLEDNSLVLGSNFARATAALYFLERIDEVEELFNEQGFFPGQSRAAFDAALAQARQYYFGLLNPTGVRPPSLRTAWELRDVWPNPSGSETHVTYRVPPAGGAHAVDVYDAVGRLVRHLFSGTRPAGDHHLEWDGRDARGARVASGVYFVRIRPANAAAVARKLVLVR